MHYLDGFDDIDWKRRLTDRNGRQNAERHISGKRTFGKTTGHV